MSVCLPVCLPACLPVISPCLSPLPSSLSLFLSLLRTYTHFDEPYSAYQTTFCEALTSLGNLETQFPNSVNSCIFNVLCLPFC